MDVMSYTAFRAELAGTLDKVVENHKPVLITRQNGKPAVVMSLEDFHAYEETSYLLSSPANAERLKRSVAQIRKGKTQNRELIEE